MSKAAIARVCFLMLMVSGCQQLSSVPTANDNFIIFPPTGLMVLSAHDASILLQWNPVSAVGFLYYNVYMGTDSSKLRFVAETSDDYFFIDSLSYTSTYFFQVTAVYANGVESPRSNYASAKPVNFFNPVQPVGLTVQGHNDNSGRYISVIWISNPDGDLGGYEVYRDTSSSFIPDTMSHTNLLTTVTTNYLKDTLDIVTDREYFYRIIAFDFAHWRSPSSDPDSDMVLQRPTLVFPANDSAVNYLDNLDFQFNPVMNSSGYILYVSTSAGGGDVFTINLPPGQDSVTYSGSPLNTGEIYFWHVAATTKDLNTPNSVSGVYSFAFTQ